MKRKLFLIISMVALLVCLLAFSVSATTATEVTPETQVTLSDGTVLGLYDENGEGLIWFILSTDENGVNTYASVPANKNTADNASSYVTYNINSTYGTNQMHDINIEYWDGSAYVSCAEGNIVVANLRTFTKEYWSIGTIFSSSNLEYIYHSKTIRDSGDYTEYAKLKIVDLSLTTNFESFGEQAFKNCTSLLEVRVGESETGYALNCQNANLFNGCTALQAVKFADPSDITEIGGSAFQNCSSLTGTYTFQNVTTIGTNAFRSSATNEGCELILHFPSLITLGGSSGDTHVFSYSGLKKIYFGDDINAMSFNTFTDCTKLEIIEFKGVASDFNFPSYTFDGCTSLKAFSIPDSMTTLPSRMFRNCTSLKAVYLPSNLKAINSGSQDHSTFINCKNMYFVNEPFTFTSDEDIPAKPDVYYFPSGLTTLSGETFKVCQSLNKTLVFPVGVKEITNAWAFEAGISNPTLENIVFLGDVESISTTWVGNSAWKFTGKIYFANANDLSTDDVSMQGLASRVVFCNAEGNETHLYLEELNREATCTVDGINGYACFCGTARSDATVVEAKGHECTEVVKISYNGVNTFFEKGDTTYTCGECGEKHTVAGDRKVIFKSLGYSATERETGRYSITQGFVVDKDAMNEYNSYSENDVVGYGLVAGTVSGLGENADVFGLDGEVNNQNAAVVDFMSRPQYDIFEIKVSGLEGSNESYEYSEAEIYCCGYCLVQIGDNVVSYYASEGKVTESLSMSTSYDTLKPADTTVTE